MFTGLVLTDGQIQWISIWAAYISDAEREHRIICLSLGGCGDCINSHKDWSDDTILYQLSDYGICTSDYVITAPRLPFRFGRDICWEVGWFDDDWDLALCRLPRVLRTCSCKDGWWVSWNEMRWCWLFRLMRWEYADCSAWDAECVDYAPGRQCRGGL